MNKCTECGSYAINHHCHGRDGSDPELCDVCYWRVRATDYATLEAECERLKNLLLAITARHFAESWKKRTSDAELEQYLSAGIAQLEAERDTLAQALGNVDREHGLLHRMKNCEIRRDRGSFGIAVMSDTLALEWQAFDKELQQLIDARHAAQVAELAAIKGQEPVAIANKGNGAFWVTWTDAGESLRGPGIRLYTLPPATLSPEVQASGPYASVADALARRYPKPSLLKECNVTYSNSSRPLAEHGERQEAVAWIVPDFGFLFPTEDAAQRYLRNINDLRKPTALYATPQPSPDVRALVSADDVRDACANAVSVFAEETNAAQCREVAEYMREVLLAQIARRQGQPSQSEGEL